VYQGANQSWSVTGKPVGTYFYRVRANGPTGQGGWSNTRSVTVSPPPVADLYIAALRYDTSDENMSRSATAGRQPRI